MLCMCMFVLGYIDSGRWCYTSHCQISRLGIVDCCIIVVVILYEWCTDPRTTIILCIMKRRFKFFFFFPFSPHTSGPLLRLNNNNNTNTIVSEVVSHNGSGPQTGGGQQRIRGAFRGSLTCPFLLFLPKTQEELVLTVFSPFVFRAHGGLLQFNPPSTNPSRRRVGISPG